MGQGPGTTDRDQGPGTMGPGPGTTDPGPRTKPGPGPGTRDQAGSTFQPSRPVRHRTSEPPTGSNHRSAMRLETTGLKATRLALRRSATLCETQKSKKMVPKWSWTTFWWIFPSGQEMVEKWSENGPRETAYITQWSKNGRKMVPGRPQTIFGVLFDHFPTIFLQIEGAAFGRPLWVLYLKENGQEMIDKNSQWSEAVLGPFFDHFLTIA